MTENPWLKTRGTFGDDLGRYEKGSLQVESTIKRPGLVTYFVDAENCQNKLVLK